MNDDKLKALKKTVALTWAYYKHDEIPPAVLQMYVADLSGHDPILVCKAYEKWRREPNNRTMPLPADIIAILSPKLSDDAASREAASRVIGAVSKFGQYQGDKARHYIGELGWEAMKRMFGGWSSLCGELTLKQTPMIQAQLRDLCKALLEARSKGMIETGPGLPGPERAAPQIESKNQNQLDSGGSDVGMTDLKEMMGKFRQLEKTR